MIAEKNTAVIEAAKTFLQMFVAQCSQRANRAGSFNPEGGGVLPYLGYTGTCHWTGYGFLASLS